MTMNKQISSILIKVCILVGAFFLGLAARTHAQTVPPGGNPVDTTHHRYGMHRDWASRDWANHDRNGNGSTRHRFHRPNGRHRGRDVIQYTPEQRQQVMAINKDYRQKTADLYNQDNITLKQYKSTLLALQKEKKDKLANLLTQQQKDQLADQRKRISENRQVREAANIERLKLRLNLTDDQVTKLKSGQAALRTQAQAIHQDDNLLPQEKMQQIKALMAKRNDTYKSVLTPDQYTQFEKMHHHRPGGFDRPDGFDHPGRHFGGPGGGPGSPGGSAAI